MLTVDDFVMLGRTEPQRTKRDGVTVCSIGYSETLGGLMRLYPIPISFHVPKFSLCSVKLTRGTDSRHESFKLAEDSRSLIVHGDIPSAHKSKLLEVLKKSRARSINQLNERRSSVGILLPSQISGKWKAKKDLSEPEQQLELTIPQNDNPLFNMPDVPVLSIVNEDGSINNLQLRDWGCSEFIRRHVITGKYSKDELWSALHFDKPQMLLVGNMRHFPTAWLTVCTFTMKDEQQSRFTQNSLF